MNILMICIILTSGHWQDENPSLSRLRKLYEQAAANRDSLQTMEQLLSCVNSQETPVLACYKGVSAMIEAKYAFNPISKFNKFNAGKAMMEAAIKRDKKNVEMRLLRYVIQNNSPAILGYHGNLEADRALLKDAGLSVRDDELRNMVARTLSLFR